MRIGGCAYEVKLTAGEGEIWRRWRGLFIFVCRVCESGLSERWRGRLKDELKGDVQLCFQIAGITGS